MIRNISAFEDSARKVVRRNLEICSSWGQLSQLLLPRIIPSPASILAFVGKWVDIDSLESFDIGAPPELRSKDTFKQELAGFVYSYLESSDRTFILCQVGSSGVNSLAIWDWSTPPHYFQASVDEGYYALKSEDREVERIGATLDDALRHWGAVVCTKYSLERCEVALDQSILGEAAANAEHLIVPAFDGDGYIIWSFAEARLGG